MGDGLSSSADDDGASDVGVDDSSVEGLGEAAESVGGADDSSVVVSSSTAFLVRDDSSSVPHEVKRSPATQARATDRTTRRRYIGLL